MITRVLGINCRIRMICLRCAPVISGLFEIVATCVFVYMLAKHELLVDSYEERHSEKSSKFTTCQK